MDPKIGLVLTWGNTSLLWQKCGKGVPTLLHPWTGP